MQECAKIMSSSFSGKNEEALSIWDSLIADGAPLHQIGLDGAMQAAEQTGDWQKALNILESVEGNWDVFPGQLAYEAALKSLRQAGERSKIEELIQKMKTNKIAWRGLEEEYLKGPEGDESSSEPLGQAERGDKGQQGEIDPNDPEPWKTYNPVEDSEWNAVTDEWAFTKKTRPPDSLFQDPMDPSKSLEFEWDELSDDPMAVKLSESEKIDQEKFENAWKYTQEGKLWCFKDEQGRPQRVAELPAFAMEEEENDPLMNTVETVDDE